MGSLGLRKRGSPRTSHVLAVTKNVQARHMQQRTLKVASLGVGLSWLKKMFELKKLSIQEPRYITSGDFGLGRLGVKNYEGISSTTTWQLLLKYTSSGEFYGNFQIANVKIACSVDRR